MYQNGSHEVAGNHEENVHPGKASAQVTKVEEHDGYHRDGSEAVELRARIQSSEFRECFIPWECFIPGIRWLRRARQLSADSSRRSGLFAADTIRLSSIFTKPFNDSDIDARRRGQQQLRRSELAGHVERQRSDTR
jgi:hypothetical protein